MTSSQTIIHWNTLATTLTGATNAVFSEPGMEEHTVVDVALIDDALRLTGGGLIEIGCGIGRLTNLIAEVTEASIFALDVSPKMIEWARSMQRPDRDIVFSVGDAQTIRSLAAAGHLADGAYSMLVFQHVPDAEVFEYITAVHAALKPGGVFVFQYVVGEMAVDFDHRRPQNRMMSWLTAAGFDFVTIDDNRHPEWKWVKAVKA